MKKNQKEETPKKESSRVFGKITKLPFFIAYSVLSIIVGIFAGVLASVVFPVAIPIQLIRIKFFKIGT